MYILSLLDVHPSSDDLSTYIRGSTQKFGEFDHKKSLTVTPSFHSLLGSSPLVCLNSPNFGGLLRMRLWKSGVPVKKFPEFLGRSSYTTLWEYPPIFSRHFPLLLKGDFKYRTVKKQLYIPKPAFCLVIKSMDPFYTEGKIGFETLKPFLFNNRYYKLLIAWRSQLVTS
jgi:hypothetical protein